MLITSLTARRATPHLPLRSALGVRLSECVDIFHPIKSRSLHYQGTRTTSLQPLPRHTLTTLTQVLVTIMATVGAETAYATDIVAVQRVYYNQVWPFACASSITRFLGSWSLKLRASHRSVDARHVHPAHRVQHR